MYTLSVSQHGDHDPYIVYFQSTDQLFIIILIPWAYSRHYRYHYQNYCHNHHHHQSASVLILPAIPLLLWLLLLLLFLILIPAVFIIFIIIHSVCDAVPSLVCPQTPLHRIIHTVPGTDNRRRAWRGLGQRCGWHLAMLGHGEPTLSCWHCAALLAHIGHLDNLRLAPPSIRRQNIPRLPSRSYVTAKSPGVSSRETPPRHPAPSTVLWYTYIGLSRRWQVNDLFTLMCWCFALLWLVAIVSVLSTSGRRSQLATSDRQFHGKFPFTSYVHINIRRRGL